MTGRGTWFRRGWWRSPDLTIILIAINLVVFAIELAVGEFLFEPVPEASPTEATTAAMIFCGGQVPGHVVAGEVWRLLTSVFLHLDVVHLAMNCIATFSLLPPVQQRIGFGRSVSLYVFGGIAGSLAAQGWRLLGPEGSAALHMHGVGIGASGAVFAVFGFLIGVFWRAKDPLGSSIRRQLLFWLLINVIYGLTAPNIGNDAHAGGFVFGLLFERLAARRPSAWTARLLGARVTTVIAIGLVVAAMTSQLVWCLGAPGAEFRRLEAIAGDWQGGLIFQPVVISPFPDVSRKRVQDMDEIIRRLDARRDIPEAATLRAYFEAVRANAAGEPLPAAEREARLRGYLHLFDRFRLRLGPLTGAA
ncbi:MAG: rhomboid family intramembrane serine protease [Planctomycetota bacterium]